MARSNPGPERHEDVVIAVQFETGRQYTDNSKRAPVETDSLADDRSVAAKLLMPDCITDCSRVLSSRLIVRGGRKPSNLRIDAEYVKEIPVHTSSIYGYRRINSGYIEDIVDEAGRVVE